MRWAASAGGTISRPASGFIIMTPFFFSSASQAARLSTADRQKRRMIARPHRRHAGIALGVVLAGQVADGLRAGIDHQPLALALHRARAKILLELGDPSGRLLGDHRHTQDAARAVGMLGPFAAIDELGRQVLADEEADHRHVRLGDAHGAELRMLGLARDLDGTIEEQRRIGLQARRLEGVEGNVGAVGGERHVGEPAALLEPLAPLGVERGVLDDAQDLEIILVEDHQVVGGAELLVEAARLHLEAELPVSRLGGIDAVDHDHDVVESLGRRVSCRLPPHHVDALGRHHQLALLVGGAPMLVDDAHPGPALGRHLVGALDPSR